MSTHPARRGYPKTKNKCKLLFYSLYSWLPRPQNHDFENTRLSNSRLSTCIGRKMFQAVKNEIYTLPIRKSRKSSCVGYLGEHYRICMKMLWTEENDTRYRLNGIVGRFSSQVSTLICLGCKYYLVTRFCIIQISSDHSRQQPFLWSDYIIKTHYCTWLLR